MVRDGSGNPVPNALVFFTPPATGATATLSATTATTDENGQASVRAAANTTSGAYQVEAAVPGVAAATTALFTLTNRAGPVSAITAASGATPQTTRVTFTFSEALHVDVTDRYGNSVPGVTITYAVPPSGPSAQLSGMAASSDAQGHAFVTAAANSIPGSYAVTASVAGGPTATFNLTNTAGPAATIEIVSGGSQVARVGAEFAPMVVAVRDGTGNLLPGQTVTFSPPASGASARPTSNVAFTDSSGRATFTATANLLNGRYVVAVSAPGNVTPVIFVLTNAAGAPARVTVLTGTAQVAVVGEQFGLPLRVFVQDAYGNPVSGAGVNFLAPAAGATARLSSAIDFTGPTGQASVHAIAGSIAGAYAVSASIAGVTGEAFFNLANAAATQGVISATGGVTQSAPVLTAFILSLTARVVDRRGNPIGGMTVTFTAPNTAASASLSARTGTTDSQGNVSVKVVANQTPGSYQVVATAPGIDGSAVFNLQNTGVLPNTPVLVAIVNAASFTVGAAPASLQTIFGNNLASDTFTATETPLPTTLGGTSVTVAGRQVPLLYVSPRQINFQMPPEANPGRVEVVVSRGSTALARAPLEIDLSAPGIFLQITSDPTRAAALNTDYTLNVPSRPAPAGDYVVLFITGIGAVTPSIAAGELAPLSPLSRSQLATRATIGPRPVNVQFAGKAPGTVGDQVNLQIPEDLPPGEYAVSIVVNGVQSNAPIISVGAPRQ